MLLLEVLGFFVMPFSRRRWGETFCLISAKWTTGYKGEIKTTESWVYKLAKMDHNWELPWVVFVAELTNLTWSQIFLVKNASFPFHLELIKSMPVSVASYSFINLLFIIIILFILRPAALLSLANTNCIYFFLKLCFLRFLFSFFFLGLGWIIFHVVLLSSPHI